MTRPLSVLRALAPVFALASALACWLVFGPAAAADGAADNAPDNVIVLQSTTSTANSGLYDHLLPLFEAETGIQVRVVPVGTGQAIKNARNGDGDVLLVHARAAEEKFVAEGFGVERFDVMYNDFVIIGPPGDPAGVRGAESAAAAMMRVARAGADTGGDARAGAGGAALFASRGDDSGTHKKELSLWRAAGVDPAPASGAWYRETGSGMGATLNIAAGMRAYALTDRATWIAFKNKSGLEIVFEGDQAMFNQYGVILVNPERHTNVNAAAGRVFIDWILSAQGQAAIAAYRREGQQMFFPNARPGARP
ncbi:MAG: ABC transporter substrate-binding protein [Rhodospirillales bacterium]